MSIKDLTITEQNVQGVLVVNQPDRLTGTAEANKKVFDAFPRLLMQRFNELLDSLAGTGGAGEIPVGPIEGVTAENVQQALAAIQHNLTAYINKIKAETGAAEVGVSPIGGMTARNVQQALAELRTAIDNIVAGIIPGGTIKAEMIDPAAIVQLGALLAVAAAAAYDPEGSYAVGDYCTHGGKLHKCNTDIQDGEPWNPAHWTETTVVAELAERMTNRGGLTNICSSVLDAVMYCSIDSSFFATSGTMLAGADDSAFPGSEVQYFVMMDNTKIRRTVIAVSYDPNAVYSIAVRTVFGEEWRGKWQPVPNIMSPEEHAIVPKNGAQLRHGCKNAFSIDPFGKVTINGILTSTAYLANSTILFTLPASFAPSESVSGAAYCLDSTNTAHPCSLVIEQNGDVRFGCNSIPADHGINTLEFSITFQAGGV